VRTAIRRGVWGRARTRRSGLNRCNQARHSDQSDGALDVVGEHMKAHLGCHVLQRAGLEVASTHPVLDGAKDMLDRAPSHAHRARHAVEPGLHRLDDLLMLPALDAALDAAGAHLR
jgi:hypothetical protein